MDNAMNELWKAQQDAAASFTESWRGLLTPAANRAPRTSAPPAGDDPTGEPVTTDTGDPADGHTTNTDSTDEDTTPEVASPGPGALEALQAIQLMQSLSDGQRQFAEHMARWAELQRDLADTLTDWASRQGEYADALDRVLAPFSPRA